MSADPPQETSSSSSPSSPSSSSSSSSASSSSSSSSSRYVTTNKTKKTTKPKYKAVKCINYETFSISSFDDLKIDDSLLRGIYAYGIEKPSPIQQKGIVPILDGRDVYLQGRFTTGTGKIEAFLIGAIPRLDLEEMKCQAMIMSPGRELACQIAHIASKIGEYCKLKCITLFGGVPIRKNMEALEEGCHMIVGTPGRTRDLIHRKLIEGEGIKIFIMHEVDEFFSKGFKEQIYDIFTWLGVGAQVIFTSTTFPMEVKEMTEKFLKDPVNIIIKCDDLRLDGIRQYYIDCEKEEWKFDTLCDLYDFLTITQSVIFCNTEQKAQELVEKMRKYDFLVEGAWEGMGREERERGMREFRCGSCRVLICTDFMARGIDVAQISATINYEMPTNYDNYLNRIGRRGRFGRKGLAINFFTSEDVWMCREIEERFGTKIEEMPHDVGDLL